MEKTINKPADKSTVNNELICGRTIDQLRKMNMPTLAKIAKLHQKHLGTVIHFAWFHFLTKDNALTLLVIGDNSNPEAKKIVDEKMAQMDVSKTNTGEGIRKYHADQAIIRDSLDKELADMEAAEIFENTAEGSEPDFSQVDKSIRKLVIASYSQLVEDNTPAEVPAETNKSKKAKK